VLALLRIVADVALPSIGSVSALAVEQPAGVVAAGTAAGTPYHVRDNRAAGPTVVITGGVHGDKPAGVCAADQNRHRLVTHGKLVVVPRVNVVALRADKRNMPGERAETTNLNRNFPKAKEAGPARGALASTLWEFARQWPPVDGSLASTAFYR
jgi:predicted deacylase